MSQVLFLALHGIMSKSIGLIFKMSLNLTTPYLCLCDTIFKVPCFNWNAKPPNLHPNSTFGLQKSILHKDTRMIKNRSYHDNNNSYNSPAMTAY